MNDKTDVSQTDEPEGLDLGSDVDGGAYPLDDIMVRSETRTVAEVVKRIARKRFIIPDFQRDFVWDTKKQSQLIESCVMRIPLPVLYVAEAPDGRIVVVDGFQRLETFSRFLGGKLSLTGLGDQHPLNGRKFSQLPLHLQERVEETQLILNILHKSAPQRAQLDIFQRVNGGVALSRQQMRNAIFNGAGTRWLKTMAGSDQFAKATGRSLDAKTMRDREAINRFAGFYLLGWGKYRGDLDDFLARTIESMNNLDENVLSALGNRFKSSMAYNYDLFGRHSFRRSLVEEKVDARRSRTNIALFDVLSWSLAKIPDDAIDAEQEKIRRRIVHLCRESEFKDAITKTTNSTAQVRTRFEAVYEELSDWIEA